MSGELRCVGCGLSKSCFDFTVNRGHRNGRSAYCKACCNARGIEARRSRGVYAPYSGHRVRGTTYIQRLCGLCGEAYEPFNRAKQRFCRPCSVLWRRVNSSLTSGRGRFAARVSIKKATVDAVARQVFSATCCAYCLRPFADPAVVSLWDAGRKSLDHRVPICRGGDPNNAGNIAICCLACNRSKAWLSFGEWLRLCRLVVAANAEVEIAAESAGVTPRHERKKQQSVVGATLPRVVVARIA
jgi:HNH endonuclease